MGTDSNAPCFRAVLMGYTVATDRRVSQMAEQESYKV